MTICDPFRRPWPINTCGRVELVRKNRGPLFVGLAGVIPTFHFHRGEVERRVWRLKMERKNRTATGIGIEKEDLRLRPRPSRNHIL
ncbi:hypothetical protein IGI04_034406 [Brassica rapa subsp. trilocularis]|uniref:Uncharacterized protein n=1 Tax=Brassica rapa subsp. trilocularis TaxID=1813537 RepID=A0ABQ7L8M9_BRACM|nr:hypothetical protein IGI04_034406 [Brassica rapa subsp. trilocularis]